MQEENREDLAKNGEDALNELNNDNDFDGNVTEISENTGVKDIIEKIAEINSGNLNTDEYVGSLGQDSEVAVVSESRSDVSEITESHNAEASSETDMLENGSENNATEANIEAVSAGKNESGENEPLEYGTMPGSWACYEAEHKQTGQPESGGGNGVYPEDGSGRINGGSYFGMGDSGSYYRQRPWQQGYSLGENPQKPKDKKKIILFAVLGTVALALIVTAAIGIFQLFNRISDSIGGNMLSPGGGQVSGGTEGGGSSQQPGNGSQGSGSPSTTPSTNKDHLQNGDFTLEQVTSDEHYKLSAVYRLVESTVVAIKSSIGSGSGVIISRDTKNNDGYYIVTNNHVIEGAENIKVTLSGGAEYSAILIGRDEATDLAVLKIIASELTVASIGKSEDMLVAEEVLVIGNPLGTLGGTATNGIISAKNRTLSIDGYTMSLLQTNAAINAGNSGGGMFNMSGQLIGVVNAKFVDEAVEGIGFAIPIDIAKAIIEDIINYGYVKGRADLGFEIAYGRNSIEWTNDYFVSEVRAGSAAETAGLKANDIIRGLKVNGVNYVGTDLSAYLKGLKVGDYLEITVRRYTQAGFNSYIPNDEVVNFTVAEYQG